MIRNKDLFLEDQEEYEQEQIYIIEEQMELEKEFYFILKEGTVVIDARDIKPEIKEEFQKLLF